jgi:hypothetical protein
VVGKRGRIIVYSRKGKKIFFKKKKNHGSGSWVINCDFFDNLQGGQGE